MSIQPAQIAKDFASAYYAQLMGPNWRQLAEWYMPDAAYSKTDEETGVATPVIGTSAISAELEKTHRKHPNCVTDLSVITAQEIPPKGNLLVQVVGSFDDQKAQTKHRFSHTFVLMKELDDAQEISYYIQNEILVYVTGHSAPRAKQQKAPKVETHEAPVAAAQPAPAKVEAPAAAPVAEVKQSAPAPAPAKEKKQQQKPKAPKKEDKPAAAPAAPKPTTWASIAKTTSDPAPAAPVSQAPVQKPKAAAAPVAPAAAKQAETQPAKAAAQPQQQKQDRLALFVGNLTPNVDEAALRKAFGAFGKVTKVDVIARKNIGFVEFDEPKSAFDAINKKFAASPITLDGKQLRIDQRDGAQRPAKAPTANGKPQRGPKAPVEQFDQEEIPSGSLLAE